MWNKLKKLFKSTAFNIFLIFLLAFLVVWLTLRKDGTAVIATLAKVSLPGLIGIFLLMVFERLLLGWGLSYECRLTHPKYTVKQGFVNAYVAGLFNNITPGASGGQIAQGYIFHKQGIPLSNSIGVLWLDFIVYQTTMCLFVLSLILLRFGYFYTKYSQLFIFVILGFLVGAGIIVFLWAIAVSPRFYTWLTTKGIDFAAKIHLVKDKEKVLANLEVQLQQFNHEIVVLKTHKKMILLLGVEDFLRLVIYYSVPFLCAMALGGKPSWSLYFDTIVLSSFVAMINAFLPMPGSSGGTEATFLLMFSTLFEKSQTASIMLLWRFMTFYQVLIVGSIVFMYAKTRKTLPLEPAVVEMTGNVQMEEKKE